MPAIYQQFDAGCLPVEFIKSFAAGDRSFDKGVLAAGQNCLAGTVLGKKTSDGKFQALTPGATDGTQTPAAILCYPTDATAAELTVTLLTRDATVGGDYLTWPAAITAPQKTAAVLALGAQGGPGIIIR